MQSLGSMAERVAFIGLYSELQSLNRDWRLYLFRPSLSQPLALYRHLRVRHVFARHGFQLTPHVAALILAETRALGEDMVRFGVRALKDGLEGDGQFASSGLKSLD